MMDTDLDDVSSGSEYIPSTSSSDDYDSDSESDGGESSAVLSTEENHLDGRTRMSTNHHKNNNHCRESDTSSHERNSTVGHSDAGPVDELDSDNVSKNSRCLSESNAKGVSVKTTYRNESGKKAKTKVNYCNFCDTQQTHIARHLKCVHDDEVEVAEALAHPIGSRERRRLFLKIANKGNKNHNVEVLKKQDGILVPRRQPPNKQPVEAYRFCVHCDGLYLRKELFRHEKNCLFKKTNSTSTGRNIQSNALLLMPIPDDVSDEFWKIILEMKNDDVTAVVKKEPLIRKLGEKLFKRHGRRTEVDGKITYDTAKTDYIRQRMRECGRLVIEGKNFGLNTMEDFVLPGNFQTVVKVVKALTGFTGVTYRIPYLALRCGNNLSAINDIVLYEAIVDNKDDKIKQV